MLIDRTRADGAAAGQRHFGLTESRHQRSKHEDRGAHRAHQIVRRYAGTGGTRVDVHLHAVVEHQLHAHLTQQFNKSRYVMQVRHVADADRFICQQAAGKYRQHGVLGAGNADLAVERYAAADQNLGHHVPKLVRSSMSAKEQTGIRAGRFNSMQKDYWRAAASSGVSVFSASAWIAPPIRSPRVA